MLSASHRIVGSEAFCPTRIGSRIASVRPRQRIEVEPGTITGHMVAVAIGAAFAMALVAWGL